MISSLSMSLTIFVRCSRRALFRIDVSSVDIDWPMVKFDTPARGLFLCTFMSKNIRFCVIICSTRGAHAQPPKESIDRYCIGVRSLNSFRVIFPFAVCYRAQCCATICEKHLTSRHYFFLAHRASTDRKNYRNELA